MLLAVVLESDPYDPALLERALESCSEALVDDVCAAPDANAQSAAPYRAHLTWRDELHLEVEVLGDETQGSALLRRNVTFLPGDPPEERYRAAGLIVASFVLAQRPAPLPPPPRALPPPPPSRPRFQRFGLDLAAVGGPALDRGRLRAGGTVRVSFRPSVHTPWLAILLASRASHRPDEPRLTWADLSIGLAGRLAQLDLLAIQARAELVLQRLFARARDSERDETEQRRLDRIGGRVGLDFMYAVTPSFLLFLGGDVARVRPRIALRVASQSAGRERAVEGSVLVGTRIVW
jgi:hypothetical protein